MEAFRDEKAALESKGATVVAISTDPPEKLAKFKAALGAQLRFVADPGAELVSLYDVKMPLVKVAKRQTFIVGRDRRIVQVISGRDAVDAGATIEACPLPGAG